MKRVERIADLLRAEHALLALMKEKGAIRAYEGKRFVESIVSIKSRRESAWDALINMGMIIPEGKGNYSLTEDGEAQLERWNRATARPDHIVGQWLNTGTTS